MTLQSKAYVYLLAGCRTDIGRLRANNEDSLLCLPEHGVFVVADGMGGAQAGEVASRVTVEEVQGVFREYRDIEGMNNLSRKRMLLEKAANFSCRRIQGIMREQGLSQCGSTFAAICFDQNQPEQGMALHAGDSRVYRWRANELEQLTQDHTYAAQRGTAVDPRLRTVLTRAVGVTSRVELEETRLDVAPDDFFLLCSDGFSNMLPKEEIQRLLESHRDEPSEEVAAHLVDTANWKGGADNISVIVIRVQPQLFRASKDAASGRHELQEPGTGREESGKAGRQEARRVAPVGEAVAGELPRRAMLKWVALGAGVLGLIGWLAACHG